MTRFQFPILFCPVCGREADIIAESPRWIMLSCCWCMTLFGINPRTEALCAAAEVTR